MYSYSARGAAKKGGGGALIGRPRLKLGPLPFLFLRATANRTEPGASESSSFESNPQSAPFPSMPAAAPPPAIVDPGGEGREETARHTAERSRTMLRLNLAIQIRREQMGGLVREGIAREARIRRREARIRAGEGRLALELVEAEGSSEVEAKTAT